MMKKKRNITGNTDISYVEPALLEIIPKLHKVPVIHEISVFKALACVKRTATGPDDLPFWFWKEYALELTPVITYFECFLSLPASPQDLEDCKCATYF